MIYKDLRANIVRKDNIPSTEWSFNGICCRRI